MNSNGILPSLHVCFYNRAWNARWQQICQVFYIVSSDHERTNENKPRILLVSLLTSRSFQPITRWLIFCLIFFHLCTPPLICQYFAPDCEVFVWVYTLWVIFSTSVEKVWYKRHNILVVVGIVVLPSCESASHVVVDGEVRNTCAKMFSEKNRFGLLDNNRQ